MNAFLSIYFFILGLLFGSFYNVCIYRIPNNLSVVKPGSHCFECKTPIKFYDNIPVVSYFLLRGKCRHCSAKFSPRYMLVELVTGILFAYTFSIFGIGWPLVRALVIISCVIVLTFIDFDHHIIPDRIHVILTITAVCSYFLIGDVSLKSSLFGFLIGGGFLLIIAFIGPMGGGDIKLMATAGLCLGALHIVISFYFGFITAGIYGTYQLLTKKKGMKSAMAFGPFLGLGILVSVLFSDQLSMYALTLIGR